LAATQALASSRRKIKQNSKKKEQKEQTQDGTKAMRKGFKRVTSSTERSVHEDGGLTLSMTEKEQFVLVFQCEFKSMIKDVNELEIGSCVLIGDQKKEPTGRNKNNKHKKGQKQ